MRLTESQWQLLLHSPQAQEARKYLKLGTNRYGFRTQPSKGIDICADEADQSQRNRERIQTHYCEPYYQHLDKVIEGWELGEPPPAGLPIDNYTHNPVIFQKSIMSLDND